MVLFLKLEQRSNKGTKTSTRLHRDSHVMDRWVDNPETVEQRKVWPDALGLAERAGPDALFRALRLVLESDYVKLEDKRKPKHPQ